MWFSTVCDFRFHKLVRYRMDIFHSPTNDVGRRISVLASPLVAVISLESSHFYLRASSHAGDARSRPARDLLPRELVAVRQTLRHDALIWLHRLSVAYLAPNLSSCSSLVGQ